MNKEKRKTVKEKLNSVSYKHDKYTIQLEGTNKTICGVVTPNGKDNILSKISEYRTIYETICDLDWSIKFSLRKALNGKYDVYTDNFYKMRLINDEEKEALYYVENALYREISLWDMLAQIYRVFYDVGVDINHVNYNRFFNPDNKNNDCFKSDACAIYKYITDEIDQNGEKSDGIHKEVVELRNSMVHRNSLGKSTMNNYDFNLRCPIYIQIELIVEDYLKASEFIRQVLDKVDESIKDYKEGNLELYGGFTIR